MRISYKLPTNKKKLKEIMMASMVVANNVKADQLNCSISIRRQPTKYSPLDVLSMGLKSKTTMWNFIINTYENEKRADVGCCVDGVNDNTTYFLWIIVSLPNAYDLVNKFKLKSSM